MDNLRKDVKLISDRINFYKSLQIEDPFKIELQLMEDLPEQYSDYPWLIKTLCKSSDTTWLNKMMSSCLEYVWLDANSNFRSKTRIIHGFVKSQSEGLLANVPVWN